MNVVDLLGWLESKYGEALNGIQQKIVSFVEFLQGNPVFKYLPGINDIDLESFRTQRSDSNNGVRGVTGDATGDRGKKFLTGDNKTGKDKSGSNKIADMTPEEQLNFLQKLRQEVAELTAEEKSLGEQLLEQNLLDYERLALLARLTEVQAKLNEIKNEGALDVSGKVGELEALSEMLKGLEDDPRFIRAGKPFTGAKQEGPAEETLGISFEQLLTTAQNIHDILNQPLDNPFKTMQAILQIVMQIGGLLGGGGAGGFLSFLGPIGMGLGLLSNIFGGLFGSSKKSGSAGGSGNMQRMGAMFRTFAQTGFLADLPPQVLAGGYSSGSMNMGQEFYFNGRLINNKFKEEMSRDGLMITEFNERKKYK
ncbi:MAG: hypothetical protein UZ05_CHB002000471 [Chlorobi bacterium OLB5]|nr:MAG: hypothetical protein UZ05_CHB002000471 [Chlorobi bacterium OLB5]